MRRLQLAALIVARADPDHRRGADTRLDRGRAAQRTAVKPRASRFVTMAAAACITSAATAAPCNAVEATERRRPGGAGPPQPGCRAARPISARPRPSFALRVSTSRSIGLSLDKARSIRRRVAGTGDFVMTRSSLPGTGWGRRGNRAAIRSSRAPRSPPRAAGRPSDGRQHCSTVSVRTPQPGSIAADSGECLHFPLGNPCGHFSPSPDAAPGRCRGGPGGSHKGTARAGVSTENVRPLPRPLQDAPDRDPPHRRKALPQPLRMLPVRIAGPVERRVRRARSQVRSRRFPVSSARSIGRCKAHRVRHPAKRRLLDLRLGDEVAGEDPLAGLGQLGLLRPGIAARPAPARRRRRAPPAPRSSAPGRRNWRRSAATSARRRSRATGRDDRGRRRPRPGEVEARLQAFVRRHGRARRASPRRAAPGTHRSARRASRRRVQLRSSASAASARASVARASGVLKPNTGSEGGDAVKRRAASSRTRSRRRGRPSGRWQGRAQGPDRRRHGRRECRGAGWRARRPAAATARPPWPRLRLGSGRTAPHRRLPAGQSSSGFASDVIAEAELRPARGRRAAGRRRHSDFSSSSIAGGLLTIGLDPVAERRGSFLRLPRGHRVPVSSSSSRSARPSISAFQRHRSRAFSSSLSGGVSSCTRRSPCGRAHSRSSCRASAGRSPGRARPRRGELLPPSSRRQAARGARCRASAPPHPR